MNFKIKRILFATTAILYFLALFIFYDFFIKTQIGNTILILFVIVYFILTLIWFRCPNCKSYLWKLTPFTKYCPHCGKELND